MRNIVEEKLNKFSDEVRHVFSQLRNIIFAVAPTAQEKLWAGLPSYYVDKAFVRLTPFKDHINVEAAALSSYKAQLRDCIFTPKNMLQIFVGQSIPTDVLTAVFKETLSS